jgi:hypothetical protein
MNASSSSTSSAANFRPPSAALAVLGEVTLHTIRLRHFSKPEKHRKYEFNIPPTLPLRDFMLSYVEPAIGSSQYATLKMYVSNCMFVCSDFAQCCLVDVLSQSHGISGKQV